MASTPRETVFQALYNLLQSGSYPFAMVNAPVSITEIGITGNVLTVTTPNQYHVGEVLYLYGIKNAAFLNGAQVTVESLITAGSPPEPVGFTAFYTYAGTYGPTADTGFATDNEGRYFKAWDQCQGGGQQPALYVQEGVQKADYGDVN